jgi:hypothetical protein
MIENSGSGRHRPITVAPPTHGDADPRIVRESTGGERMDRAVGQHRSSPIAAESV